MFEAIYIVAMILFLFGITIFVHELGHFLVARWCGLVAETFAIGFGPALWKRKIGDVTYRINVFPVGGYVALPQMDPGGMDGKGEQALPGVAPWKKLLVSLAGVTGNLIFAFFLAWVIYFVGRPAMPEESSSVIGWVSAESEAAKQGLRAGDELVSVNGVPVANWQGFLQSAALDSTVELSAKGVDGKDKTVSLATEATAMGPYMVPGISGISFCLVAGTSPGSSAERAGMKPGDLITSIDGVKVYSRPQLIDLVQLYRDVPVDVGIDRDGEEITLSVTPQYNEKADRALIGIQFNTMAADLETMVHEPPLHQIRSHFSMILQFLKALVTPKQAAIAAEGVGGPLMIFYILWWVVKSSFMLALWFTCLINIHLIVINLLPIPILDGGHVVFALIEMVRGRPLGHRVVGVLGSIFSILIISLFLLLSYRDVVRFYIPMFRSAPTEDVQGAVTNAPAVSATDAPVESAE